VFPTPPPSPNDPALLRPEDHLGSWKAIAAYLKRDVSTVQRWEKSEGMPVHRHLHAKRGSVYGSRSELDAWWASRGLRLDSRPATHYHWPVAALAAVLVGAGAVTAWLLSDSNRAPVDPLKGARYSMLTEFDGAEQAAALSRDGQFAAFLSDRDGSNDVWVTHVGTGEFHNLTQGRAAELVNEDVRSIAFSPDGSLVSFWQRSVAPPDGTPPINIWGIPTMGGAPHAYLIGGAELAWSADASRVVYHPPAPGDPFLISDSIQRPGHRIYESPPGVHNHFPVWSPDDQYIYFVRGMPPEPTDIWRIQPDGASPQRMTSHESAVSYPTFIDRRTLLYLATAADGTGPWLHMLDVKRRVSHRITTGVERYTSLAASADGRRLVLTTTRSKSSLWRASIPDDGTASEATPITARTLGGRSPRLGDGLLIFVAPKGQQDAIWKLVDGIATELWSTTGGRLAGAPALSPDGKQIAFAVERYARTTLHVMSVDGMDAHPKSEALDVRGSPAWSPDGRTIAVAVLERGAPRLYIVPLDGTAPVRITDAHAQDPSWSPDGRFIVYSDAEVGPSFAVKAVTADGRPWPLPPLTLSRGARRLCVLEGGRALVALRGEIGRGDLVQIDLASGTERRLTGFGNDFVVRDFDVSPDGREVVFDRRSDDTDLVLIDRRPRDQL
jgi:Tol biopolymer transport system component